MVTTTKHWRPTFEVMKMATEDEVLKTIGYQRANDAIELAGAGNTTLYVHRRKNTNAREGIANKR
ncbi:hypothetical protein HPB50_001390 [Hyalomma asiaticum]|uniref:Uncharacterized protein n=1 Tax=Hyalomma asiaticum TaxID=266040 RepID=A0ACB7RXP4_HYAAI|nr:hypothetical protein HPB50_001390 [Hyalomma asiaticum]